MGKIRTIDSFFVKGKDKVIDSQQQQSDPMSESNCNDHSIHEEEPPLKSPRIESREDDASKPRSVDSLIRDPGLRPSIWDYPVDQRDEIRRAYIRLGPYQPHQSKYDRSGPDGHRRSFQEAWYKNFSWLEYSPTKDAAFCFPCYLFTKKPLGRVGSDTFTVKGFNAWKKVNGGKDCAFLTHIGKTPSSAHNYSVRCHQDLKNQLCHIETVIEKQTSQQVMNNRLRLKTSIDAVRWLTFQACALRGHDERPSSRNQGNFLELVKLLASYNKDVDDVVLDNAPQNAKYTSPDIQKEILLVFAMNVQKMIRNEIGKAKFCLMVDEARDESKKEQMAIVVRFVDQNGYVKERFLDLVHVKDTTSVTLKNEISASLSHHELHVQDIRGQGYDGASNMRGEWNGLQALFLKECPYAYYVHCLAHQLQLALVAASKDVSEVHTFFKNLSFIVNIIGSSCKRNDQLQAAQVTEISYLVEIGELETGRGVNQIATLQRPGDTRWSSHYRSICSLINLFGPAVTVIQDIAIQGTTSSQRGDALFALKQLLSFDFVLVMHMMKEMMAITDDLCQALQKKSQDIVNALALVSSTKKLIEKLRNERWQSLLIDVVSFCGRHDITVPDMNAAYIDIIRSRCKKENVTVEHHYRVDVFVGAIDYQLQELDSRFSKQMTELLLLSVALDPRDSYKSFNIENICKLADKFYPSDFTEQEKIHLKYQLQHYELDVPHHPQLKNASTIAELCRELKETGKSEIYPLVDRLIRLILTLPVSTATTERAFSAMKIVKTRLRSSMSDDYLKNHLIVYIEREIAEIFSTDKIIDDFYALKERRAHLKMHKRSS